MSGDVGLLLIASPSGTKRVQTGIVQKPPMI